MAVRYVAALLALMAFAATANAQGSLRLPPMPEAKPAAPPPATAPAPAPSPAPAPKAATTNRTNLVQSIQILLRDQGLYDNTTNGTLGPATRAAIREFQRSNGQPETGEPSEKLLEDLQKKQAH